MVPPPSVSTSSMPPPPAGSASPVYISCLSHSHSLRCIAPLATNLSVYGLGSQIHPAGYIRLARGPPAPHKLPLISHPLCTGCASHGSFQPRPTPAWYTSRRRTTLLSWCPRLQRKCAAADNRGITNPSMHQFVCTAGTMCTLNWSSNQR